MALQFTRSGDRFGIELEIEVPGAAADHVAVSITQGGRTKRVRHPTLEAAAQKYHQTIALKLDEGFVLEVEGASVEEPAPTTFTPFPDLERLVDEQPDSIEHWVALAGAWQGAGDPRGDCIQAERSLAGVNDVGEYARLKKRVENARRSRNAHVWGSLGRDAYRVRAVFRDGLVDRFMFPNEVGAPGRPAAELLAIALATPFARFVREVHIPAGASELAGVIAASPRAGRVELLVY